MSLLSNSLDRLPDDVQSMYLSIMNRIDSQQGEYPLFAKRAMTWIMNARRPLTIAELQHALAIREGENSFHARDIPIQDMFSTSSCGIIEILPRSETDAPLLDYAYQNWTFHVGKCDAESYPTEILVDFVLHTPNYPLFDSRIGFSWITPGHVIAYYGLRVPFCWEDSCNSRTTKRHTPLTLAALNGCTTVVKSLLESTCIDVNVQTNSGDTALILACKEGHHLIVNMLLLHKDINLNLWNKRGLTALMYSSILNRISIIRTLVSMRKINPNIQDVRGTTALMHASHIGNIDTVRALLACSNIDINATDLNGRTSLLYACLKDCTDVARLLLQHPSIDVNSQDDNGHTALLLAATKNSLQIFESLLGVPGLDPDLRDSNGLTALSVAIIRGHNSIAQALFMISKFRMEISGRQSLTALVRATVEGYVPIIDILFTSKIINPNVYIIGSEQLYELIRCQLRYLDTRHVEHAEGMTPLMLASSAGQKEVVKRLLTIPGIDVNLGNNPGSTLVEYNRGSNDHPPTMDSFPNGMDLRNTCFECSGLTALMFAASHGHVDVLQSLLAAPDINVNGRDSYKAMALMWM
uniref:Ankyrin repeat protein n=1 Tax=Psilocybe cubensis TaxID=181762 RepID=A0A8H7Y463_PSICU